MYISTKSIGRDSARACIQSKNSPPEFPSYQRKINKSFQGFRYFIAKIKIYTNTLPAVERGSDGGRSQYHRGQQTNKQKAKRRLTKALTRLPYRYMGIVKSQQKA